MLDAQYCRKKSVQNSDEYIEETMPKEPLVTYSLALNAVNVN